MQTLLFPSLQVRAKALLLHEVTASTAQVAGAAVLSVVMPSSSSNLTPTADTVPLRHKIVASARTHQISSIRAWDPHMNRAASCHKKHESKAPAIAVSAPMPPQSAGCTAGVTPGPYQHKDLLRGITK
jgi:hypothetical protein